EPRAAAVRNPYSVLPNWLYPTFVVVALSLFALYAAWVVLFFKDGRFGPYLSPFNSPEFRVTVAGFAIPTGIWIFWIPLVFRFTCYSSRKAISRSSLWPPGSCAAKEPSRGTYLGETRLFIFNNLHRFAFYIVVLQVAVLWYDAIVAFISN